MSLNIHHAISAGIDSCEKPVIDDIDISMGKIAVLIPCHNESATIANVITDFKSQLPSANIYVYDNNSSDKTAEIAEQLGAAVKYVTHRGKGFVVQRMFADIEADTYVLVDGDHTYDASCVKPAIALLQNQNLDMVVCARQALNDHSFRFGHRIGNKCFTQVINILFNQKLKDIFSGYRIFSRRFVKSFPAVSQGFEIEAEITMHALQLELPFTEMETAYQERPKGSFSKLKTVQDGICILRTILLLFMYSRPLAFFGFFFVIFTALSLTLGIPIINYFLQTGLVPRLPTALLAASFSLLAGLSLACGIVLDSISRSRLETKKFWYLLMSQVKS